MVKNLFARWIIRSVIFFGFSFLFLNPVYVTAATGISQFAGCSGTDCSACNIVDLTNGLIKWLIGFLFVLFAVLVAYAGFGLVTSGGNHHALDEAKSRFMNAFIGMIVILSAWLIVDTIMRGLVGNASNPGSVPQSINSDGEVTGWLFWTNVQCYEQTEPDDDVKPYEPDPFEPYEVYNDGSSISESGIPAPSQTPPISTAPAVISGNLVTYAGAKFDSGIVGKVQYIATTFGLRVSGGYRTPERNRAVGGVANSYHLTGRAADFVGTQEQMLAARQWARNNGAREALIHNAGSGTHLHVAW